MDSCNHHNTSLKGRNREMEMEESDIMTVHLVR